MSELVAWASDALLLELSLRIIEHAREHGRVTISDVVELTALPWLRLSAEMWASKQTVVALAG